MNIKQFSLMTTAAAFLCATALPMPAQDLAHAVAGVVKHVDHAAKTIVVKTAEGTEQTFTYTGKTTWHMAKHVEKGAVKTGKETEKGLKEGAHVVVHYTGAEQAGKATAVEVRRIDHAAMKAVKGTVTAVDHTAKTVAVKTADGTEHVVKFGEATVLATGKGVEKGTFTAAKGLEKGAKVSVHYTEEAGVKVAHLIKKIF